MKNDIIYQIKGMHCQSCVEKIRKALSQQVDSIDVSLNPPQLTVSGGIAENIVELNTYIKKAGNYELVKAESRNPASATEHAHHASHLDKNQEVNDSPSFFKTYYPLLLTFSLIIGGTLLLASRENFISSANIMFDFMGLFFIFFSFFKLLNISGFADAYSTYDVLAQRWHTWGFIYPFVELGLGIAYLCRFHLFYTNLITIIVMGFSAIGVINALRQKRKIQCACLGTIFNLPMSKITLLEDLLMVVMAFSMLI